MELAKEAIELHMAGLRADVGQVPVTDCDIERVEINAAIENNAAIEINAA